ncbi:sigma-70 family RNA polymerase sigma factor [Actinosynnema sp. NPDC020468]|uniref:sigma-70 family RNA polymerase sigma factor n=1 Tax=Actinosynnema sp. NPDC020468 TaxID=3154488 RepID=UPI0033CC9D90
MPELPADVGSARAGDDAAFGRLVAPLRRELHAHCYRLLGSGHDADDALQEALVRAWRGFAGFEGRSSVRSWLYAVATRTCLDAIRARGRRALPVDLGPSGDRVVVGDAPRTDVAWLGPYPDLGPDGAYERREAVELAFVAALQHLPGNQRAALLLFEVVGLPAAEIAAIMGTSATSVNSALARARRVLAAKAPTPAARPTDARTREVVARYSAALEEGDADALVALLTEDVTWSMPPLPRWYRGVAAVRDFVVTVPMGSCGSWRHLPTWANGTAAVACYLGTDGGPHTAWSINVLTLRDGLVAEVTSFLGAEHFGPFGLPLSVD